jgi:hypothetical protein
MPQRLASVIIPDRTLAAGAPIHSVRPAKALQERASIRNRGLATCQKALAIAMAARAGHLQGTGTTLFCQLFVSGV